MRNDVLDKYLDEEGCNVRYNKDTSHSLRANPRVLAADTFHDEFPVKIVVERQKGSWCRDNE